MDELGAFSLTLIADPAQPFRDLISTCPETQQLFGISVEQLQRDPQCYLLGLLTRLLETLETGQLKPELGHLEKLLSVCGALHAAAEGPPLHCFLALAYKEVYIHHFLRGVPSLQVLRALLQPSVQSSLAHTAVNCFFLASQALIEEKYPPQASRNRRGRGSSASSASQRDERYLSLSGSVQTRLDCMFEQLMIVCQLALLRPSPLFRARVPPDLELSVSLLLKLSGVFLMSFQGSGMDAYPGICPPSKVKVSCYNPFQLLDQLMFPRLLEQLLLHVAVHFGSYKFQEGVQSKVFFEALRLWWAALQIVRCPSKEALKQQQQQQRHQAGKNSKGMSRGTTGRGQAKTEQGMTADEQAFEQFRLAWLGVLDKAVWTCHVLQWRKKDMFKPVVCDGQHILADDVLRLGIFTLSLQNPETTFTPRLGLQTSVASIVWAAADSEKPGDTWAVCFHLSALTNLLHTLNALLNRYKARLCGESGSQGTRHGSVVIGGTPGTHDHNSSGSYALPHEGSNDSSTFCSSTNNNTKSITANTTNATSSYSTTSRKSDMQHVATLFIASTRLLTRLQNPSAPQAGRSSDDDANTALRALRRMHFVQRGMLAEALMNVVYLTTHTHPGILCLLPHKGALHLLSYMLQALSSQLTPAPGYKPPQVVEDPTVRFYAASTCIALDYAAPVRFAVDIMQSFCCTLSSYAVAQRPLAEATRVPHPILEHIYLCDFTVGAFQTLYLKYWLEGLPEANAAFATEVADCALKFIECSRPFLEHEPPLPLQPLQQGKKGKDYCLSVAVSLWVLPSLIIPLLKAGLALARLSEFQTNTHMTQGIEHAHMMHWSDPALTVLLAVEGAPECLHLVHITMGIVRGCGTIPAHWLAGLEETVRMFSSELGSFDNPDNISFDEALITIKSPFAKQLQSWAASFTGAVDKISGPPPASEPASPSVLQQQCVLSYNSRTRLQLRALTDTLSAVWRSGLVSRVKHDSVLPRLCANMACETPHFCMHEEGIKSTCPACGLIFCEKCIGSYSYREHLEVCHRPPSGAGHQSFSSSTTSEVTRIEIPPPTVDEKKEVMEEVENNRKQAIEAAIIRTMKRHKVLHYQELVMEVQQLIGTFKPDSSIIKRRIEDLIEREYMERVHGNPQMFKYLA